MNVTYLIPKANKIEMLLVLLYSSPPPFAMETRLFGFPGKSMSGVFGVSGPKDVEALTGPTRQHHSKTSSGTAVAAKARPSITHKVEISTEDVDFFDTSPSDGRFDASMTWSGDNGQGQSLRAVSYPLIK